MKPWGHWGQKNLYSFSRRLSAAARVASEVTVGLAGLVEKGAMDVIPGSDFTATEAERSSTKGR